jgi:hypothetical protein
VVQPSDAIDFLGFLEFHAGAALALSETLDQKFIGTPGPADVVAQDLAETFVRFNAGDHDAAIVNTMRLAMLGRDLQLLAGERPEAFRTMRDQLKSGNRTAYYGTRCEIAVAASLTRAGVEFEYDLDGQADLVYTGGAGVECTSAHLTHEARTRTLRKLHRAVTDKASKPYCHSNTRPRGRLY